LALIQKKPKHSIMEKIDLNKLTDEELLVEKKTDEI